MKKQTEGQTEFKFQGFIDDAGVPKLAEKKKRAAKPDQDQRGCKYCPLNKIEGIKKIKGEILGKSILIVCQSPGPEENSKGLELVGPAGKWLWAECAEVGIEREDCDIQNAVRCIPATWQRGTYDDYLKMRDPTKEEIHCCSIYNERAIEQSKAKQVLVFGKIAQQSFLKLRSIPAEKSFWSDELNAKVYLFDHPAYFVRGYGKGPRLNAFREQLANVARDRKLLSRGKDVKKGSTLSDPYFALKQQDYRLVTTEEQAVEARKIIRIHAKKGHRVSFDIEADKDEKGNWYVFCCGFSPKPGLSFVFLLNGDIACPTCGGEGDTCRDPYHEAGAVLDIAREILEDSKIKKVAHYGVSDTWQLRHMVGGIKVKGWDWDTMLSDFLRFSDLKSYGLDAITERSFPQFSGYKTIICRDLVANNEAVPEKIRKTLPGVQYTWLQNHSEYFHLSKLQPDTLRLYNGGDCDLTKRIEVRDKKKVPLALMRLYIDLTRLLHRMEPKGPLFDFEQCKKLQMIYPAKEQQLRQELQKMVGDPNFNPGSPDQVYEVLYSDNRLGLTYPFKGKPNTGKDALIALGREHPFPKKILEWRSVAKVKTTYLTAYESCAKVNNGRLRTKWHATGTRTGRLSSGGDKNKKKGDVKVINLQNIKKDADIKNMCVADRRWHEVYDAIGQIIDYGFPEIKQFWKLEDEVAKWNKKHPDNPKPKLKVTEHMKALFIKCSNMILDWIRENMPDLKIYLVFDYGQVEVRVYAQIADDKNLIKDCSESDIHTKVGVTLTGWDADRIKNDEAVRTITKNCHFGILFLLAKDNLVRFVETRTPEDMKGRISKQMIYRAYDRYFKRYGNIQKYMDRQLDFVREHGYVETLFGMIQTINVSEDKDQFRDGEDVEGAYWGAQAVNGPVQGTAHQLVSCGEVNLVRKRKKYKLLGTPPMEVHDALYFGVPVLEFEQAFGLGKYLLEQESLNTVKKDFPHIDWKVPIVVDAKAGIRLGGVMKVDENTKPGPLMLDWYRLTKTQIENLDQELEKAAELQQKLDLEAEKTLGCR